MTFSDLRYSEVKLGKTGLQTVVTQLRFNPILKIGQEAPADFQDRVRHLFPKFVREERIEFRLAFGEAAEAVPPNLEAPQRGPASWRFSTEDDVWVAGLSANVLSLETARYEDFLQFEERFAILHRALTAVYAIDHYVRVGLRFINIIESEHFDGELTEKFNPQLLGPLADGVIGSDVREGRQTFVISSDDWTITVRHGTENGNYRLDIDHATEARVAADQIDERLRAFNSRAYQLFRWAISDGLHQQMEPENT